MSLNRNETNITVQIDTAYISLDEYARRTGRTREAVKQQCKKGKLPVAPRENDRSPYFVNNALLITQAIQREY